MMSSAADGQPRSPSSADTAPDEFAHLGQRLAALSDTHGTDGIDVDRPRRGGAIEDQFGHRSVIVDRVRVRHAGDSGKATRGRGVGTRRNRFLVLEAGLAQVHVHVHEAGADEHSRNVENLGVVGVEVSPDRADEAVLDEQIVDRIEIVGRIDDPTSLKQKFRHEKDCPLRADRGLPFVQRGRC
jgi:hypothetical protein